MKQMRLLTDGVARLDGECVHKEVHVHNVARISTFDWGNDMSPSHPCITHPRTQGWS